MRVIVRGELKMRRLFTCNYCYKEEYGEVIGVVVRDWKEPKELLGIGQGGSQVDFPVGWSRKHPDILTCSDCLRQFR